MRYKAYVATYAGESQKVNKDNYFLNGICREDVQELSCFAEDKNFRSRNLYALVSGTKNAVKGEEAAYLSVDVLKGFYGADFTKESRTYFGFANSAVKSLIFEKKQDEFEVDISVVYIGNDVATVYNMGDAPVFYFKDGFFKKLTGEVPKSVEDAKNIRDDEGEWQTVFEKKDTIPYIGFAGEGEAVPHASEPIKLKGSGILLICSKSVIDILGENEIVDVLKDKNIKSKDKTGKIIELAAEKQPDGNYTAEIIETKSGISVSSNDTSSLVKWLAVVVACVVFSVSFAFVADSIGSVISSIKTFVSENMPKREEVDSPVWIPKVAQEEPEKEKVEEKDEQKDVAEKSPQVTKPAPSSKPANKTPDNQSSSTKKPAESTNQDVPVQKEMNTDVELPIDFN